MKRIYILLLFAFLSAGALQAQWRELHTGVTENLYDVCCVDTNTVFVCGQNGVILKTIDGGDTWQELYRQEGRELCKIAFFDQNVGYAGGNDGADNGVLMRTTDGGETWEDVNNTIVFKNDYRDFVESHHMYNDTYDDLFSCQTIMLVFSSDTVLVYQQNTLFISIDNGVNFIQQTFTDGRINGVYIEDNFCCVVLYDMDNTIVKVKKSFDLGVTWENDVNFDWDTFNFAYDKNFIVYFVDKEHVKIIGAAQIIETFDGFGTIETSGLLSYIGFSLGGPFDMDFSSENIGCYVYNLEEDKEMKGNPYLTCGAEITWDGGYTWIDEPGIFHQYNYYYSLAAVDSMFYISSESGKIYHYSVRNYERIEEQSDKITTIFPNPTHDKITIEGKEIKRVEIFDLVGREIMSQTYNTSNDKIEMDLSDIQDGLYIIKVYDKNGCNKLKINKIR